MINFEGHGDSIPNGGKAVSSSKHSVTGLEGGLERGREERRQGGRERELRVGKERGGKDHSEDNITE